MNIIILEKSDTWILDMKYYMEQEKQHIRQFAIDFQ